MATRTLALDEAVRQEHRLFGIVVLLDAARLYQPVGFQAFVNRGRELPRFLRVGGIVVIESDVETREIPFMLLLHPGDQRLRRDAFLLRPQHDRRAMSIVSTDIMTLMPAHLMEPDPDIGLDVFDKMAQMNRTVGIGQGAGDEDFAWGHGWLRD